VKVAVVSGIWPPDVGGPASHAPEFADFLHGRGHDVVVVTTADARPEPRPYAVSWTPRRYPPGVRHFVGAGFVHRAARDADVVYSTGMLGRSALGSRLAGAPLVQRLAGDPAYERALRRGLTTAPLDRFQQERGARIAALRRTRDRALGRAARIVVPSEAFAGVVAGWEIAPGRIEVVPHAVSAPRLGDRDELRRLHGLDGPTLVFAGRLVPQKALGVALRAVARNDGVTLLLAGDGPERARVEALAREVGLDGRARFLGARPRATVFELLRAADASLLSSDWESFGLVVAEALAVGTPVVAAAAGGVSEVLEDGCNGLLVPAGDVDALAEAIGRFFADGELRSRLRAAAAESVRRLEPAAIYPRLERILVKAAR
jgi:glycosyltransferase involved in cell wall biosynthesis